jgi:spoIIIJ-associated protein
MMSLFEDEPTLESLEVTARTVNEAIDKALTQLGLTRDQVVVSVLSEGSRGILGIGQEDARILVSPREPIAPRPPPAPAPAPASVSTVSPEPVAPPARPRPQLSSEQVADLARDVLDNLLSGMRIPAEVEILPVPQNARDEGFQVMLNIVVGTDDVASLIGRRGENLSAIQFMTTLILAKKAGKWTKVLVDVEGYRQRREQSLRSLAARIAQRVQQTHQPMALEAMPPNERRIVHLALQSHPAVTTASTGEGDQRRVVISPKR